MRFIYNFIYLQASKGRTMEDKNLIVVAKKEYTIKLNLILTPTIYEGLQHLWNRAKTSGLSVFIEFQRNLSLIPKWNSDIIDHEYRRILERESNCTPAFLDKLIEVIFILNTQVLAVINPHPKMKITVPDAHKFIHTCYKEAGRLFYSQPRLFEDRPQMLSHKDMEKNFSKAIKLIHEAIENSIRNLLPMDLIMDSGDDTNTNNNKKPVEELPSQVEEEEIIPAVQLLPEKESSPELSVVEGSSPENFKVPPPPPPSPEENGGVIIPKSILKKESILEPKVLFDDLE